MESGDLARLDRAISWLVYQGSRFLQRNPGYLGELTISDPVDALLAQLRSGIPEEIGITTAQPGHGDALGYNRAQQKNDESVLQHGSYVTVLRNHEAVATDGQDGTWRLGSCPDDLMPWYDGESWHMSRPRAAGHWQTFLVDGPPVIA